MANASPVRIARTVAGMSQAELADAAGVDPTAIGRLERGVHRPRRLTRRAISEALGLSEKRLFPELADKESADRTAE